MKLIVEVFDEAARSNKGLQPTQAIGRSLRELPQARAAETQAVRPEKILSKRHEE